VSLLYPYFFFFSPFSLFQLYLTFIFLRDIISPEVCFPGAPSQFLIVSLLFFCAHFFFSMPGIPVNLVCDDSSGSCFSRHWIPFVLHPLYGILPLLVLDMIFSSCKPLSSFPPALSLSFFVYSVYPFLLDYPLTSFFFFPLLFLLSFPLYTLSSFFFFFNRPVMKSWLLLLVNSASSVPVKVLNNFFFLLGSDLHSSPPISWLFFFFEVLPVFFDGFYLFFSFYSLMSFFPH